MNQFHLAGLSMLGYDEELSGPFKKIAAKFRAKIQARRAAGKTSPLDYLKQAIQTDAGNAAAGTQPPNAGNMPSWVIPAALGGVGLVAVMVLAKKRGRR